MSFSGNDYSRFLSQGNAPVPRASRSQGTVPRASNSHGNASRNCNPSSPASQNQQAGLSPPPSNQNSPNPSHSATHPPTGRLNDLTLEELLDSPGRQSLQRLDPNRPPGTLWFDIDVSVAASVRKIFERDFKEPHANWTQTPDAVVNRWYETFAQMYNWDKSINERVRDEFEDKLKDRMSDQVSRWKGKWKNIGDEAKPKWIDPEVWAGLVRFGVILSQKLGVSTVEMLDIMIPMALCEETGDSTPDFLVVLEQTHRKPDGTFIDKKSEEIYKEVSSRIEEEESQLFTGDNTESSASGGLSVAAKNKIYAQVILYTCCSDPRKKGRLYGVGSLQNEASSVHVGPLPTHNDRQVLLEKLAAAEARLQLQAEKINSFDAYWQYLAEKDPVFAGMYQGPSEPANAEATRTAEGNEAGGDQTGTDQTGGTETGTGTRPASSTSQAF
ncbi:putative transposase Ptta/En/Spm plant [Arabidopsis thaliana x Arabidopsis arenosa]|uniref:Putative transposase Ptta/En/Spm plant n=1 Tax=Arabidopsis thaliana x Arabidopsis arenosa TaxID=1240361 RepID=A0A8T2AX88_9BRAS|nr:putative transposase Ptta/En/Spm plant [Arabidopsis thaliana x Arabidopsis arenosa]